MKKQMITSLTFQDNNAENAMNFYVALFNNSKVVKLNVGPRAVRSKKAKSCRPLSNLMAPFMCSDSPAVHDWDFSPAVSSYLECDDGPKWTGCFQALREPQRDHAPQQLRVQSKIRLGDRPVWRVLAAELGITNEDYGLEPSATARRSDLPWYAKRRTIFTTRVGRKPSAVLLRQPVDPPPFSRQQYCETLGQSLICKRTRHKNIGMPTQ